MSEVHQMFSQQETRLHSQTPFELIMYNILALEQEITMSSLEATISIGKQCQDQFQRSDSKILCSNSEHQAAIKLQKVYKSFRTRRKLADGAVLIAQSWWKLLDFAELKRSSISFFDLDKNETAISRWSRARTRAAKVGKGLSKNNRAQKLALQHWLEAIDPRHRYGHNLHFYYIKWLHSKSYEPFFYWLDIGEGKEVNLSERCSRSKLQQQCIKYLGPMERTAYEVVIEDGKLLYKQTGELLNSDEIKGTKWIFVLSTFKTLYVGKKIKGAFQHSSFLAGGATLSAGRIVVKNGVLTAVWPHSGHYQPTSENFHDFISFLEDNGVNISGVKVKHGMEFTMDSPDEEDSIGRKCISHTRNNSYDEDMDEKEHFDTEDLTLEETSLTAEEQSVDSEKIDEAAEQNLFVGGTEALEDTMSEQFIQQRTNSLTGMKSHQLAKRLSGKWSTGVGPRIGCLRDYTLGLQSHALEQVNLSPKRASSDRSSSYLFQFLASTSFREETQVATIQEPLQTLLQLTHDNDGYTD